MSDITTQTTDGAATAGLSEANSAAAAFIGFQETINLVIEQLNNGETDIAIADDGTVVNENMSLEDRISAILFGINEDGQETEGALTEKLETFITTMLFNTDASNEVSMFAYYLEQEFRKLLLPEDNGELSSTMQSIWDMVEQQFSGDEDGVPPFLINAVIQAFNSILDEGLEGEQGIQMIKAMNGAIEKLIHDVHILGDNYVPRLEQDLVNLKKRVDKLASQSVDPLSFKTKERTNASSGGVE